MIENDDHPVRSVDVADDLIEYRVKTSSKNTESIVQRKSFQKCLFEKKTHFCLPDGLQLK